MRNIKNVTVKISFVCLFVSTLMPPKEATTNDLFVCILKVLCLVLVFHLLVLKTALSVGLKFFGANCREIGLKKCYLESSKIKLTNGARTVYGVHMPKAN